jgi:hypothetical protein
MLRATQPAGAVFALGWVMAELFDPRRRASVTVRTPPFDPDTQLPLVPDLAADPKLVFLAAELSELLQWFPALSGPLRLVTAATHRKSAAVAAENLATAEAAAQADDTLQADDVMHAETATAAVAATAFSETEFLGEVWASLATVAVVLGSSTYGLGSGVSSAFSGLGYDIWNAAKLDAAAWGVTWLPALTTTTVERAKMDRRGVAVPQIRKSLDI